MYLCIFIFNSEFSRLIFIPYHEPCSFRSVFTPPACVLNFYGNQKWKKNPTKRKRLSDAVARWFTLTLITLSHLSNYNNSEWIVQCATFIPLTVQCDRETDFSPQIVWKLFDFCCYCCCWIIESVLYCYHSANKLSVGW